MYLAAANALARARTVCLSARIGRQASLPFDVARRVQFWQLQRNASSSVKASATTRELTEDPDLRKLYTDARQLRSELPLERALAEVRDLLHAPNNASLRPDKRLLTIMLGHDTYQLSAIERISEILGMDPHHKLWTTVIIHAVAMRDMDEALRLYDEAWARATPPLNAAAQSIIRGLVHPPNGGTFAEMDDILKAVSILKRQMQRQPPKRERDPPMDLDRLMTAVAGNPTIPERTRLIDDILSAFRECDWKLVRHARRVSKLLDFIYRAPSHSDSVAKVAEQDDLSLDDYRRLLTHIARIRFDTESVMSRVDLLRFVDLAETRGKGDIALFVAYFTALRDILLPDDPPPQMLATVRDMEQHVLAKYGALAAADHQHFDTILLALYGRLAGSGDVLPDLLRCWSRVAALNKPIMDRTICVALRDFPSSHVREIWDHRVNRGGALSTRLWNNWVQTLCRMGEVDEAFAVFQEHLGDRYPGANAGCTLFASARSAEEQKRWADVLPRTWASMRTQRFLPLERQ